MGKGKVWKGLCLYIRYIWKEKKSIYLMGILFFPAYILSNYLQVYLPKMVIMELEEKRTITHFGISIMGLSFFLILCIFIKVKMLSRIKYSNRFINQRMQNEYSQKLLYVDYKYLEDQEFLTVRDKVKESLFGGSVGDEWERAKLADFMETLVTLAAVTGNVVLYAYHLCKLSYWMLAIFLIAPFIMVLTQKTVMKNERDNAVKASGVWQKLDYVIRKTEDFSMAKDVRMYQMDVWLSGLLEKLCKKRLEYKAKELKPRCALSVISTLVFGVYHAGLFAAILAGLWNGNINVADVVFYAGMGPALYFLPNRHTSYSSLSHNKSITL